MHPLTTANNGRIHSNIKDPQNIMDSSRNRILSSSVSLKNSSRNIKNKPLENGQIIDILEIEEDPEFDLRTNLKL
jgi:hypothetical protein